MTGFAAKRGESGEYTWTWDIRSVNARGLDIRLRVPDWIEGLETACRSRLSKAVGRGNVTLSLRVARQEQNNLPQLNIDRVDQLFAMIIDVEKAAQKKNVEMAKVSAADILNQRGVTDVSTDMLEKEFAKLAATLLADMEGLIEDFLTMRAAEGRALHQVLTAQVDEIERLTKDATGVITARKSAMIETFQAQIARVMDNSDGVDEARLTQELAILAVKSDVTEEIDRLWAHISAARDLLAETGPIGRKFDFLTQEFNREANTLCSKAQFTDLTNVGLSLKAVIDQMREQVQNVE